MWMTSEEMIIFVDCDRTVTKVYRMVWLKSTTPEELYARKVRLARN